MNLDDFIGQYVIGLSFNYSNAYHTHNHKRMIDALESNQSFTVRIELDRSSPRGRSIETQSEGRLF